MSALPHTAPQWLRFPILYEDKRQPARGTRAFLSCGLQDGPRLPAQKVQGWGQPAGPVAQVGPAFLVWPHGRWGQLTPPQLPRYLLDRIHRPEGREPGHLGPLAGKREETWEAWAPYGFAGWDSGRRMLSTRTPGWRWQGGDAWVHVEKGKGYVSKGAGLGRRHLHCPWL